jgi:hypothetical protein
MVARLIPLLHDPHPILGDTSDDLHGSGRLFAAATSKFLMGDLFAAARTESRWSGLNPYTPVW